MPAVGDISMDLQPADWLLITVEYRARVALHDLLVRFCQLQFIPKCLSTPKPLPPARCDAIAVRQLAGHHVHDLLQIAQFPQSRRFDSQNFGEPVINRPQIPSRPEQQDPALQRFEQGRQHCFGTGSYLRRARSGPGRKIAAAAPFRYARIIWRKMAHWTPLVRRPSDYREVCRIQ